MFGGEKTERKCPENKISERKVLYSFLPCFSRFFCKVHVSRVICTFVVIFHYPYSDGDYETWWIKIVMMILWMVLKFGNECLDLPMSIVSRHSWFCRTILCVLGALLLLGTCLDYTRNHWHQEMVPDLNMKGVKIEPDENAPLFNGAQSQDQQPVVVSIHDTNGSVTILTIFTL